MNEFVQLKFEGGADITQLLPNVIDEVKRNCEKAGGKLLEAYVTQGRSDAILKLELPNPEASMSVWFATHAATGGGFHTETLSAVPYERVKNIIDQATQWAKTSPVKPIYRETPQTA